MTSKIKVSSEIGYLAAIVLLSLAVAMLSAADFGISMIVAPAYLLSLKLPFLSFGQAEYVIQAGLFIVLCVVLRKFRAVYLFSFITCLIYGFVLDLWRMIPFFNPSATEPGSMALWLRIVMFVVGVSVTSFAIALFFKTYLYPQVYDFFCESRFGEIRDQAGSAENHRRSLLPHGGGDNDVCLFRRIQGHRLGDVCHGCSERNGDRSVFKADRQGV